MDNELILEIFDSQCDLPEVVPGFNFMDSFPSFYQFVESLS